MTRLLKNLTFRVLVAIAIGVVLGIVAPDTAKAMRPLGDTFIALVKMVIGPIIFLTIVLGIANMVDLKKVGKVGGKALLYFEIVTTVALAIGLVVVNVIKPGEGINTAALAKGDISKYAEQGKAMSFVDFVTHIVPSSIVDAFAKGDMLQVVFVAVMFGAGLIGFSFSRSLPLSLMLILLAGAGMMEQMAASNTILQTIVDDDKRGRVMSFYSMAFMGMAPFGSLLAGTAATRIGAPNTLLTGGILCLGGAAWFASYLPVIREAVRPIYRRLGILPEIAQAIETVSLLQVPPED